MKQDRNQSRSGHARQEDADGNNEEPWYHLKSKEFHKELAQHRVECVIEERKRKEGTSDEMTNATKDAIIGAKFDFATLSGCVSDIRKSFWNLERGNEFYKKKLKATHSHFYQ